MIPFLWNGEAHSSLPNSTIQNFHLEGVPPFFPIPFLHFKRGLTVLVIVSLDSVFEPNQSSTFSRPFGP
jgi:hypothetical protein